MREGILTGEAAPGVVGGAQLGAQVGQPPAQGWWDAYGKSLLTIALIVPVAAVLLRGKRR